MHFAEQVGVSESLAIAQEGCFARMQRLRKCIGVDIGTSSIKVVELSAEKTGVRVVRMARAELNLPPGPMDNERISATAKALKELLSKNKIGTKQAVFSVPGQSVFIRRIKVPRTTEERLHRIVAYEARQQIPFALDNALMEYQVFDLGDAPELEVLLVAIKKDIVLEFMKVVNKSGLKPVAISVSSLALFNFYAFDAMSAEEVVDLLSPRRKKPASKKAGEGEKKKGGLFSFGKKKSVAAAAAAMAVAESTTMVEEGEAPDEFGEDFYEEVRAFVNVGAQTFDLAIGRFGKERALGFTRSVPYAGNELTRSLQEKLGLESMEAAEEMKRNSALIVIPGREEEASEPGMNPEACEFATSWADRMILDLRKSFDFYISQPDGLAVDSIFISGGQGKQRNLVAYIEDKLGIPVRLKETPETEGLILADTATNAAGGNDISSYLVALGLGLNGLGLGKITVDFLPHELKTVRDLKKKNVELFLLAGAIIGMIGISTQIGTKEMENMSRWLDDNQTKLDTIQRTKREIDEARSARNAVASQINALGAAIGDRLYWLEFLGVLESAKPPDVVLVSVSCKPTGGVDLLCETEGLGSVSAFSQELKNQKEWVKKVDITIPPAPAFSSLVGKQVYRFGLHIDLFWKKTRLATARETLFPGQIVPTATPANQARWGGGAFDDPAAHIR